MTFPKLHYKNLKGQITMKSRYKYNFTESEILILECWEDIVLLFKDVQRERMDSAISENKEYIINCLVEFICKLDNLNQQFKERVNDDCLGILSKALVDLMSEVSLKVSEEGAPMFYERVNKLFKKSARVEY
ncbi:TPA: hypothetical protein ACU297_002762 [Staphylococcus aureus]|nr:hypothetical protein [Staphylococcus aureus]HDE6765601.1 hypothetical protein [Staphylococcus aureus]